DAHGAKSVHFHAAAKKRLDFGGHRGWNVSRTAHSGWPFGSRMANRAGGHGGARSTTPDDNRRWRSAAWLARRRLIKNRFRADGQYRDIVGVFTAVRNRIGSPTGGFNWRCVS